MKIIDKQKLKKQSAVLRLRKEIEIQSTLDHEYIVKLLDFFEDESYVYIVLEHCEGGELFT